MDLTTNVAATLSSTVKGFIYTIFARFISLNFPEMANLINMAPIAYLTA